MAGIALLAWIIGCGMSFKLGTESVSIGPFRLNSWAEAVQRDYRSPLRVFLGRAYWSSWTGGTMAFLGIGWALSKGTSWGWPAMAALGASLSYPACFAASLAGILYKRAVIAEKEGTSRGGLPTWADEVSRWRSRRKALRGQTDKGKARRRNKQP